MSSGPFQFSFVMDAGTMGGAREGGGTFLGGTDETRLVLGCPGMPPMPEPHANPRSNSSSRGDTENPGLPRSTVACATHCPGRLHASHSTGLVLTTAQKPSRDSCASARAILLGGAILRLSPVFCLLHLNITVQRRQFRRATCHPLHSRTPLVLLIGQTVPDSGDSGMS